MLSLPPSVRIPLAREPADMRKGFDGLSHLVEGMLQEDPLSGHLFVFRNRRGDRVKLLLWDSDGFLIVYKRLEKGTFRFPEPWGCSSTDAWSNSADRIPRRVRGCHHSLVGRRGSSEPVDWLYNARDHPNPGCRCGR